jgi:outer membrane immunogenic protein
LAWRSELDAGRLDNRRGREYAITDNVTLRAEYLYYDLGGSNVVTVANLAASVFFPGVYATAKYDYDGSIVRVGVNLKF